MGGEEGERQTDREKTVGQTDRKADKTGRHTDSSKQCCVAPSSLDS